MLGEGRIPLTLAMLTMLPPRSCALHHRVGLLRAHERGREVERDDPGREPRRCGRGVGRRRATRVVDEHVERAEALGGGRDHGVDLFGLAHVGGDEQPPVGEILGLVAAADRDVRAGIGEALRDAPTDAATPAGDEHDAVVESRQLGGIGHGGGVYDLTPRQIDRRAPQTHQNQEQECPFPTSA